MSRVSIEKQLVDSSNSVIEIVATNMGDNFFSRTLNFPGDLIYL